MANSKVDIANIALKKLGQRKITSFTQSGSSQAEVINNCYTDILEEVLSEHPWSFAQKRVALSAVVSADVSRTIENDTTAPTLITAATAADPVVITSDNHGLDNGDKIVITGVSGMTELNGNTYYVAGKTNDTFQLNDEDGDTIDGTGFTTYTSGGQIQKATNNTPVTITGATAADPVVITTLAAHGLSDGDWVKIIGVQGMTNLNSNFYIVDDATSTTFSLNDTDGDDVDGSAFSAYTYGGIILPAPDMVATTDETVVVYQKPSDYVKLIKKSSQQALVKVEQDKIISDITDLKIQYTFLNTNVSQYFPQFVNALATRLAAEIAYEVTGSVKKASDMLELYHGKVLGSALSVDSSQGTPDEISQDEWLNAQIVGSTHPVTTGETWHYD